MKRKFVCKQTTRFGNVVYYFRRSKTSPRLRLPDDPDSPEFIKYYMMALEGRDFQLPPPARVVDAQKFTRSVELAAKNAVYRAKSRARVRGMEFNLSYAWTMETIRAQEHRCLLTGIHFDHTYSTKGRMKPYSPSIDRIDCKRGYTEDNCRMIVSAMNIMLSDWGPSVFGDVARGFARTRRIKGEQWEPLT